MDFRATGLPLEIGGVLKRALAKDPAARYASGAQLLEALRTAGQTTLVAASTAGRIVAPPPLPSPAPAVAEPAVAASAGRREVASASAYRAAGRRAPRHGNPRRHRRRHPPRR